MPAIAGEKFSVRGKRTGAILALPTSYKMQGQAEMSHDLWANVSANPLLVLESRNKTTGFSPAGPIHL
ncbi:MAG: hypothetical protein Kow0077_24420 [Anaerolineae bacterium]